MKKERLRLLDTLFEAGFTTEDAVLKIGLPEVLKMPSKLSFSQLELLDQLQSALREKKLLSWIAGTFPPVPQVDDYENR